MLCWMSFTPNLKRFKAHLTDPKSHLSRTSLVLPQFHHLNIRLEDNYSFNELEKLLSLFPSLYYFYLKLETNEENDLLLQPSSWQHLLKDQLSNLIIFQFQFQFQFNSIHSSSSQSSTESVFQQRFDHHSYFQHTCHTWKLNSTISTISSIQLFQVFQVFSTVFTKWGCHEIETSRHRIEFGLSSIEQQCAGTRCFAEGS